MRNKIKVIENFIILLLCIVAVGSLTYAWVMLNKNLDANNEQIQLELRGVTIESYSVYQYNEELNQVDLIDTTDGHFKMTAYDSIFDERNDNTPLLFAFKIRDINPTQNSFNITLNCVPGHDYIASQTGSDDDNYTSNLVYMKATTSDAIGIEPLSDLQNEDATTRKNFFNNIKDWFKNTDNSSSYSKNQFLSPISPYTKQDSIYLNIAVPEDNDGTVTVYMILDYDSDLVELQNITYFGQIDITSQDRNKVEFKNDITTIILY